MHEKCANTELFLVLISCIRTWNNSVFGHFLRSGWTRNKQIMRKHQCGTTSKWWRSVVAVSNDSQVSFANSFLHLNKFWASPMWFNLTVLSANILSFSQNLINSTVVNTQIAHINLCPKVLRRLFKAWLQEVQFLLLSATEFFQYSAGHPLMIFLVSIGKEVVCL